MTIGPSMGVGGKSHIFPGLGFNHNKEKKLFLYSQRERSLSPSLGSRYDTSDVKAVYQSVFVDVSENWWVSLTLSVTGQKFSPIFKHGNDCLQKGIPPTAVTLQPTNMTQNLEIGEYS